MDNPNQQSADHSRSIPRQISGAGASVSHCASCEMVLPAGARFCLNCGRPVRASTQTDEAYVTHFAAAAPLPLVEKVRAAAYLTGERRLATAVFVDVVGSTALSEQIGPAAWSAILDKMCDWFCTIIYRYEGTIARFVGDELLAFFGAPVAHEDDPVRAVHAALEILDAATQGASEIRHEFGVDFGVRISLSTGPVTIGPVSQDLQFEYSALEGTLNLAARVEATKHSMAVLLSEETYRLVSPFFDCVDLGAVDVEGQMEGVHIYQVSGIKENSARVRGLGGLESPMVGRGPELETLLQLTEEVSAGLGRAALIVGESGLGKTRLVSEWKSAVAQTAFASSLQWAEGHCLSYGQERAFHLLRDLLRSLIGVSATAGEPETRAALRSLTTELFGDSVLDIYPYLGHLLSLTLEKEAAQRIEPLDPPALQAQYLAAYRRLLSAMAERGTLVLLLEDLQWADSSSVAILGQLLPLAGSLPLLFCLVTRPHHGRPGWKLVTTIRESMGGRLSELRLGVLTETESRQLIANLLESNTLPEHVQHHIHRKAEGNPLFVEELLRMLVDQGAIQRRDGAWQASTAISTVGIPDNLQGLLLARVDRLPEDVRQTLRVAAVIGRRFSIRVLEQVMSNSLGPMTLVNHLGELESSGLIDVYQVKPELTYRFRNTLLQDVVYASLLPADRKRIHSAVGITMEQLYPATIELFAPQLAHHFLAAGDTSRAFKYFALAGDIALHASANDEALGRFRQALELAPSRSEQAALMSRIGQALYWQGRFQDAIQVWGEGIDLFQALGDSDGLARLYAHSARAIWGAGDTPAGLRICQEGLKEVAGASESPGLALLLHEAARAHLFNGLAAEARHLCQKALTMAERLGDVLVQAEALATLGLLPDQTPEAALASLSRAAELAESANLFGQAARAHVNLAAIKATSMPEFASARDHYRRAAEFQRLRGNLAGELLALGGMIGAMLDLGQFSEVDEVLPVAHQLLSELADPGPGAFHVRLGEALLQRYRGELATAYQMLKALQAEERQRGNLQNLVDADIYVAEVVLASHFLPNQTGTGAWDDAQAALTEAIEITDRWSKRGIQARCLLSMVFAGQSEHDVARQILDDARTRSGAEPTAPEVGWLSLAEARLAAAEARWPDALTAFENVAAIYAQLDMRWQRARVLLEWAEAHSARREPTDLERARSLLREASSLFKGMDVTFYAGLAEDWLRHIEVESFAQALAYQKVDQEMAAAGRIQTGLLPARPPELPGWQLAAALEPSRQTSGDFFDFIALPDGRLGIVIADVADKGAAAALFMALSSSLIRTYAGEPGIQPGAVLGETNRRILADTHTDLFVTVFYAVLDPVSGTLHFSNAGHNPPYLFQRDGGDIEALARTGIPVGILNDAAWTTESVQLAPGDVLVLYTDGVTDAEDKQGSFFSAEQLLRTVQANPGRSAQQIRDAILQAVRQFSGGAPQFDDIALVVLAREQT